MEYSTFCDPNVRDTNHECGVVGKAMYLISAIPIILFYLHTFQTVNMHSKKDFKSMPKN